jgi:Putative Ig domain
MTCKGRNIESKLGVLLVKRTMRATTPRHGGSGMRRHLSHVLALIALVGLLGAITVTHASVASTAPPPPGNIDTLAGGGTLTGEGIPATSAHFGFVYGVAVNSRGDVFASDYCSIKKISGATMTTAVGTGVCPQYPNSIGDGGPATLAGVGARSELAFDAHDNLYISDTWDCVIRKVDAATGTIMTVAGRAFYCDGTDDRTQGVPATSVQMTFPWGIAVGPDGSVYFSEPGSCIVRKVTDGIISTFAGTGTLSGPILGGTCGAFAGDGGSATSAALSEPRGLAVDSAGNVFIDDDRHCRVREVSGGIITTVAGTGACYFSPDGPAATTELNPFGGLAVDSGGDLLMADAEDCLIRKLHDGNVITVAGSLVFPFPGAPEVYTSICGFGGDGGPATQALLNGPVGLAADAFGNLYIADVINSRIRVVHGPTPPPISVNVSPSLAVPGSQGTTVGSSLAFTVTATDANADPLVLSARGLPTGLAFVDNGDGTGSVSGVVTGVPGTYHAQFWASDGTIPGAAGTVDIVVIPPGTPPTLVVPAALSVQYSDPLSFSITATDPDGDPLTLTAAGLPAGLSFFDHGDGTGAIFGAVTASTGTYTATFSANDNWFPPTMRTVTITVQPEDATITYTGDVTKPGGSLITVSAKVIDAADGAPGDLTKLQVTFDVHGLVSGLNLSSGPVHVNASGIASFTFRPAMDPNVYQVVVTPDANQYFAISPTSEEIGVYNRAASESGTGWVSDGGSKADFSFNAKYGASDQLQGQLQYTYRADGQTIKLKSSRLQWLVVLGNVAVLRGTATANGVPGYVFELTVVDNGSGASDTLALTIWAPDGSAQHAEPASGLGGGSVIVRTR